MKVPKSYTSTLSHRLQPAQTPQASARQMIKLNIAKVQSSAQRPDTGAASPQMRLPVNYPLEVNGLLANYCRPDSATPQASASSAVKLTSAQQLTESQAKQKIAELSTMMIETQTATCIHESIIYIAQSYLVLSQAPDKHAQHLSSISALAQNLQHKWQPAPSTEVSAAQDELQSLISKLELLETTRKAWIDSEEAVS